MPKKLAAIGAVLIACAPAKAPPRGSRLIRQLGQALDVPKAAPQMHYLDLDEVAGVTRLGVPFHISPGWFFLARMQLHRSQGKLPTVTIRSITPAEAGALGKGPQPLRGPLPGKPVGGCFIGGETGDWVSCQRFDTLENLNGDGLIVFEGDEIGVRWLSVVDPEFPSPVTPDSPLLAPLLHHLPWQIVPNVFSWRDALSADGAARYAFDVPLQPGSQLRVALSLHPHGPLVPARFVVKLDGQVLLDEVVRAPGWQDRAVALGSSASHGTLELLTTPAEPGQVPQALWGDPRVVPPLQRPSIVLITLDAVRAGHLGLYGYGRDTSPNLDKLGKLGVVFERATPQAPRTWQSVFSFLTGRYPTRAGVREQGTPLSPDEVTLPEVLSTYGYDTWAGSDLAAIPPSMLGRFDDEERVAVDGDPPRMARLVAAQMRGLASQIAQRPTFAWLHLENAHYPLQPSEPGRFDPGYHGLFESGYSLKDRLKYPSEKDLTPPQQNHLRAVYDSAIHDDDALVGLLVKSLIDAGVSENTILVITADHGTLLTERGLAIEHDTWFEPVLHVPLLVVWTAQLAPRRVQQRVQLVDLMPTLLSLADVPAPPELDGRDLGPLLRGQPLPDAPAFVEVNPLCRVMYRGDEKLLLSHKDTTIGLIGATFHIPEHALYDVARDPEERDDLSAKEPARLQAAIDELHAEADREHRGAPASRRSLGQAAVQALRQAGYLAGRPDEPAQ